MFSFIGSPWCLLKWPHHIVFPPAMKEFLLLFSLTSIWFLSLFQILAILIGVWASHVALVKKNAPAMQET